MLLTAYSLLLCGEPSTFQKEGARVDTSKLTDNHIL